MKRGASVLKGLFVKPFLLQLAHCADVKLHGFHKRLAFHLFLTKRVFAGGFAEGGFREAMNYNVGSESLRSRLSDVDITKILLCGVL